MTPKRFKAVCTETGNVLPIPAFLPEEIHGSPDGVFEYILPTNVEYCQSTGLHDSRGAEVFEGDVIAVNDSGKIELFYVAYIIDKDKSSSACYSLIPLGQEYDGWSYALYIVCSCPIIGNRWQPAKELKARAEAVSNG